ncbi:MAG: hypothetical protein CFE21_02125 [Bacteroidetes bacterium B1(2017)]|nr:MAG: hypothetical protein CFE21_02125 [Bacteroidetes bacterium B1(2017)]
MDYSTGIVFSGGGVRGFAHAGVLKALEEHGIFPDVLSGVSAGAMAGVLYADGYTPDEMLEIFLHLDLYKLLKFRGFKLGLLSPDGLRKLLAKHIRAKSFEDLKIPMTIACTNLDLAQTVYFNEGPILDPLIASIAFPFLIKPQLINGQHFVDGGLMNNLPVQPLIGHVKNIIGIHVNPIHQEANKKSTGTYFDKIIHLGLRANMLNHIPSCNLFIEPPELSAFHLLKLSSAKEIFEKGYTYTCSFLEKQDNLKRYQRA